MMTFFPAAMKMDYILGKSNEVDSKRNWIFIENLDFLLRFSIISFDLKNEIKNFWWKLQPKLKFQLRSKLLVTFGIQANQIGRLFENAFEN